jgi:signal transduction histidine kinase
VLARELKSLAAVGGLEEGVVAPVERDGDELPDHLIVVDQKDLAQRRAPGAVAQGGMLDHGLEWRRMTSGALLGRIELVHTLLAAARRLTAAERACLWHGGLAHALGEGAVGLADAARRASAGVELVERIGAAIVIAVPLVGTVGGLAVGLATDDASPEPRRIALLGRLAGQGGAALATWAADRPFWDGLVDGAAADARSAASTRTEGTTSLVVAGATVEFDTSAWRAVRRLEAEIVDDAAHELRTPLTAVRAHAEILPDVLTDANDTARRFLGVIDAEAQRMGAMLDELRAVLSLERTVVVHR